MIDKARLWIRSIILGLDFGRSWFPLTHRRALSIVIWSKDTAYMKALSIKGDFRQKSRGSNTYPLQEKWWLGVGGWKLVSLGVLYDYKTDKQDFWWNSIFPDFLVGFETKKLQILENPWFPIAIYIGDLTWFSRTCRVFFCKPYQKIRKNRISPKILFVRFIII